MNIYKRNYNKLKYLIFLYFPIQMLLIQPVYFNIWDS